MSQKDLQNSYREGFQVVGQKLIAEDPMDYYKEQRKQAYKHVTEERRSLDKAIFILLTGALVLVINLLFGLKIYFSNQDIILFSIILLLISIVAHIFAYKYSELQSITHIEELDNWRRKGFATESRIFSVSNKYSKQIKIFNEITFWTFLIGIIALLIFSYFNFLRINEKNMEKEKEEKAGEVQKHAAPNIVQPFIAPEETPQIQPAEKPQDESNLGNGDKK
jgi:hypothetical protein